MGIKEEEEGEEAFARDLENVVGTLREEREKIRELGTGKLLRRDGGLAMFAFLMTEGFESLLIEFLNIFVCFGSECLEDKKGRSLSVLSLLLTSSLFKMRGSSLRMAQKSLLIE